MQDVSDLAFWKVCARRGDPDLYYTEYFRVHKVSRPDKHIVRSIVENPSGKPVIAQMIGEDIGALVRTALELQELPIAGVDLNLGCPAPIVCRKSAGGGLLRDPQKIDDILAALRPVTSVLTVKTRVGYESPSEFPRLLDIFAKHQIDALAVHGRTVREGYAQGVHDECFGIATSRMPCPVFANGSINTPERALDIVARYGVAGVMVGREAVRNPWVFSQMRAAFCGEEPRAETPAEVLDYIRDLYVEKRVPGMAGVTHVAMMKKCMNFIAEGRSEGNAFLQEIRRVVTEEDFFEICNRYLASSCS